MTDRTFGAPIRRLEDEALLTGRGRYVDDIELPDMLHAVFVRSPYAHARIKGIDASFAKGATGVQAVITWADLPASVREKRLPAIPNPSVKQNVMPYALARDEVCFVGEPVVMVIAATRLQAEDAAEQVVVDYEKLSAAVDARAALASGAAAAHAGATDNVAAILNHAYGEVDAAFASAAHVVSESLFIHRGGGHSMEGRAILASYDESIDLLTVYAAVQGPFAVKRELIALLERDEEQIRVIAPDVGGGFGPKMGFYPEHAAVAAASLILGRPIKWVESRSEHFLSCAQERDQYWDVEMGLDLEGRILGLRGRLIHDKGAYMHHSVILPTISATTVPGPYLVPAYKLETYVVLTNKVSVSPVRGAGRPQAVFAMERLMDAAARATGIDRAEIRRRNLIPPERMPYAVGLVFRDGQPLVYDSGDYPTCQALALEAIGYDGFADRRAAAQAKGRLIGIGLASCVEGTGLGPFEGATVRIGGSGRITLLTGAAAQGQGHRTCLAQIVADQFGAKPEDIRVVAADTAAIANGMGTFGSRIAVNAGSSSLLAAQQVREKVLRIASHILEAAIEDLEIAAGMVSIKGSDVRVSLQQVARMVTGMSGFALPKDIEPGLEATRYFTPEQAVYANGTHVAEVEIDPETGVVDILNYAIAHDCGVVINPLVVDGQVQGGLAHGIGNALLEWMHYDDATGEAWTGSFMDYALPRADHVPSPIIRHLESPSPRNPLGVKGAGEGGTIPAIAAIVSAVEDALSPYGAHITRAPITPPQVLALIQAGAEKSPSSEPRPVGQNRLRNSGAFE